jgi:hypothetical protein
MAKLAPITLTHSGHHYVLGYTQTAIELWSTKQLRRARVASYPNTHDGYSAAVGHFWSLEPGTGRDVTAARSTLVPRRLTREGAGVVLLAAAIVAAATTIGAVALASGSSRVPAAAVGTHKAGGTGGASPAPTGAVINAAKGWVYTDPASALFIQWTQTGSSLTGSLAEAYLQTADAQTVSTQNDAFSGVVSVDSVYLTFPQGFGTVTNLSVQIQGVNLVLSLPQQDGTLLPVTLSPGAATDYNQAVAALQSQAAGNVQSSQSQAAQASQAAANAAAQAAADQAVENAAASLSSDLSTLSGDVGGLNSAISDAGGSLQQERADLTTTQQDAQHVESEASTASPGDSQVCADASGVQADASGVDADQSGVQASLNGIDANVGPVQTQLSAVVADQQALTQAQRADPGYHTQTPIPSSAQIGTAKSAARAALTTASHTKTSDTATAASLSQQAHQAADAATKAGGC